MNSKNKRDEENNENSNENENLLAEDEKPEVKLKKEKNESFKNYWNFVKFNLWIAAMAFLGAFWLNICSFIVSKQYSIQMMAAQASLISVDSLNITIGSGLGIVVSSKLSKLMVQNKIKVVKRLTAVCFTIFIVIGLIIGVLAYVYCNEFAAFLNNNLEVQIYLTDDIKWWAIYSAFHT